MTEATSNDAVEDLRIKHVTPNPGNLFTKKSFWLNAYLALLQNNSPEEAEKLADQSLEIAARRWKNAHEHKVARFIATCDEAI